MKFKYFNNQLIAKYKICIKKYKCDSCKILKEYNRSITYFKNKKCDVYIYSEKHCQYIIEKYFVNNLKKNRKHVDCKNLLLKYSSDGKYSDFINYCNISSQLI